MMNLDQIHQLDIGLQAVIRKLANGYAAGTLTQGEFVFNFHQMRGTKEITIVVLKDYTRKKPDAKVPDNSH